MLDKGFDGAILKNTDIVILGTGHPHLIDVGMLKENTLVIDFGYGMKDGKICGDFNPLQSTTNNTQQTTIFYTPTPGGTGPILVAKLFENFFFLIEKNGA